MATISFRVLSWFYKMNLVFLKGIDRTDKIPVIIILHVLSIVCNIITLPLLLVTVMFVWLSMLVCKNFDETKGYIAYRNVYEEFLYLLLNNKKTD